MVLLDKQSNYVRGSTLVATLHPGHVTQDYAHSLAQLCLANPYGSIIGIHSVRTARSYMGRNEAIKAFLDGPAERLLWIDSDMQFLPDAYKILYDEMNQTADAKITSALAFIYSPVQSKISPNIFNQADDGMYDLAEDYERDGRFWCDATGVAFTLIHREVFEAVGYPWHEDHIDHPDIGGPMGHDVSFFHEAGKRGYKVRYCADAKTAHIKFFAANEKAFEQSVALEAARNEGTSK